MNPKVTRICPSPRCSRPELHPGKCGMITSDELKKALPHLQGSLTERTRWHRANK